MTVSTNLNRIQTDGDGATVAFPTTGFVFFDASDLEVYIVDTTVTPVTETLKTITTHYTVAGGDGAAGTVTMLTAPTVDERLLIIRIVPLTQTVDLVNNDINDAEVVEDVFDRGVMALQQLNEELDRSIKLQISSSSTDLSIPEPVSLEVLRWNLAADALESIDLTSTVQTSETNAAASAAAAAVSAAAAAADAVSTGNDAAATAADAVSTGNDAVATAADAVSTGNDATATAADAVSTGNDATATAADAVSTAADEALTDADAIATAADAVSTGNDATATAADAVSTAADAASTAADVVTTNADVATLDGLLQSINVQTGTTYTLVLTDINKLITMNNAAAMTITVPPNSSVAFAVGSALDIVRKGAGSLTLTQGAGVTIQKPGAFTLSAQWSAVSLVKIGTDQWIAMGDLDA